MITGHAYKGVNKAVVYIKHVIEPSGNMGLLNRIKTKSKISLSLTLRRHPQGPHLDYK